MRVRMLRHITGSRNGVEWPLTGGEVDLPEAEATELVANGYAEAVTGPESAAPTASRPRRRQKGSTHEATPGDTGGRAAGTRGSDGSSASKDAKASPDPDTGSSAAG